MSTWAILTALSAVHILTWSPELGLDTEVAKLSCGVSLCSCLVLATDLRPRLEQLTAALAANIATTALQFAGKYAKYYYINRINEIARLDN